MVYKELNKLILILIFFLSKNILYANIIYDKNNVIISELDLNYYKEMHYEKYDENINNSKALKNLVIIKNVISSLKKNNQDFLKKIVNKTNVKKAKIGIYISGEKIISVILGNSEF